MTRLLLTAGSLALLLTACGRPSEDADVKFVGVGSDPDAIGPAPTPYGGIVEYDHVDLAGAGLPLGLMGLSGYDAVGPQLASFEPPYEGVFAFSYIFDQQLPAADTLIQIGAAAPAIEESCYTAIEPAGPIGSFNTVDVGDYMDLFTADDAQGMRLSRFPGDYPPDPQDMFVYYIGFQFFTPEPMTHLVPSEEDPTNPLAMREEIYRKANFPFGQPVRFSFPGGFSRFDQPISSIPQPSHGENELMMPDALGGVMLEWTGPRYDHTGAIIDEGLQRRCFEFYEGRSEDPSAWEDCNEAVQLPTSIGEYDSFRGQMYTAPWESEDGVKFTWEPKANGDEVVLSVRFLRKVDHTDPALSYAGVPSEDGGYRPASVCEDDVGEIESVFDEEMYAVGYDDRGEPIFDAGLQGDPTSNMISVTCLLADDGEFTMTPDKFREAFEYLEVNDAEAGGAVFYLSRGSSIEAEVPAAKDPYDQRHEISPIKVLSRTVRIGRFWCGNDGCLPPASDL